MPLGLEELGVTPLMQAATDRRLARVRQLFAEGANVYARGKDGKTAISAIEAAPSLVRRRRRVIKILEAAGRVR